MKTKYLTLALGLLLTICMSACSARRGVPYTEPLQTEAEEVVQGKLLYERYCNSCHPGGTSGLGPALNNKPLPGFLVRFQIRKGIGAMPAFSDEAISDKEAKMIVAYMKELRKLD